MVFDFGQLVLVKRYLLGSLAVAILPLLLVAVLYDQHSSNLMDRLLLERIKGDLETTAVKINGFVDTQIKRLESIADLPEISSAFDESFGQSLSPRLLDFLYFEIGAPDIYSLSFYNTEGLLVRTFPSWSEDSSSSESIIAIGESSAEAQIIGPVLPKAGQPGWFLIKKSVLRGGQIIGTLVLKIRLASMTEQTAPLYVRGAYEPLIMTPNQEALSVVGRIMEPTALLAQSKEFLPGWSIALKNTGGIIKEPDIRRWLLLVVVASALGVTWLFVSMSKRLAHMITPLNDGAQAIASGDLATLVPENGLGELGTLARSFNNMSKQLSEMINSRVYSERQASLGKLATGIAHEIRNPLATIRTTVHGLIRSEREPSRKEMLQTVNNEVTRTDAIVEEFMNYARPREPHKELVVIEDILSSVFTLTSASALESGVKMGMTGDASLIIKVDPGQLSQILMNIILNALQAMPNGGHLTLRTHRQKKRVHLMIIDTGIGIPEEQLVEIQTPFFTTKKGGTGLGLSICSQLIHVNDGTLEIESILGEGTTICITFPLVK
ncbi:MAG: ATP-binding protein [Cellvibrionaceae bacterium]